MTREEEEEVRLLLSRHQERIMLDLGSTDLLAVLVKNSVLSQSEEDLLLKPYAAASASAATSAAAAAEPDSAPSSVGALTKRKLSAVASSSSGSGSGGSASVSGVGVGGGDYSSSLAGSSRSASVNGDHAQSDNRSLTPSVGGNLNDAEILRLQCANLIDIIAKSGFEKFKQFCYAIECECPQLIEDLINDRLKSDAANSGESPSEEKIQKEIETIDYIDK
ncbi:hypothetical protein KR044_008215 [Drosophila immigrans]|nr:hypothetical protein KR044_008215 [Drosophila immigrans]